MVRGGLRPDGFLHTGLLHSGILHSRLWEVGGLGLRRNRSGLGVDGRRLGGGRLWLCHGDFDLRDDLCLDLR